MVLERRDSPLSADFLDTVLSFLDRAITVTLFEVAAMLHELGEEHRAHAALAVATT